MRRNSIQLLLLLVVFGGPLVLAVIVYYGPWDFARQGSSEHGELMNPPVALPTPLRGMSTAEWLQRRWSLIYASEVACEYTCIGRLNQLNQVRLALGKDLGRVQVIMLFAGTSPALPAGADVMLARLDTAEAAPLLALLAELGLDRVYIADPLGRLVLSYPADVDQTSLLEDLERLLRLSPFD